MIAIPDTTRSAVVAPAERRGSGGVSVLGLTDGAGALRIISREAAKPRSREAAKPRSREAAKPPTCVFKAVARITPPRLTPP